jgi:hypothetical protein
VEKLVCSIDKLPFALLYESAVDQHNGTEFV